MKITKCKNFKKADVYVVGIYSNKNDILGQLDKNLKQKIKDYILKQEGFKPDFGTFYLLNNLNSDIDKILVVGLGRKDNLNSFKLQDLGAKIYKELEKMPNNKTVIVDIEENNLHLIDGIKSISYKFDKYKTNKKEETIKEISFINIDDKMLEMANIITNCITFTKDLINEQAHIMTPKRVSEIATDIAVKNKLKIKIYEEKELEKMGMNAYLAVARGSFEKPKFIHLTYSVKNPKKKIALVGKGITFDAGGLDIKPATSMLDMKDDMSGCACILGVIQAISKLKPDVEVHIISALCENMPSGNAYKQGDILTAKNGKTIEVDNTDAEGRLTLADALCFADELNVDEIIDVATLTGAQVVALGSRISAIMGTNKKMIDKIIKCGEEMGEDLWQMPIKEDMKDNLQSIFADMKNTGGREAGTSTAGWFLSNFVKNKNWSHIDIAGTAYISKPYRQHSKGAVGIMVKTLINYILG